MAALGRGADIAQVPDFASYAEKLLDIRFEGAAV